MTAQAVVPTVEQTMAILRALDKMTARVEVLEIPVHKATSFGSLIITAQTCRVTLPEETPETAAFLEISELKPGAKDTPIFHGWMFASSPALSAMEHPTYDIWLIGCKGNPEPPPAASPDSTAKPADANPPAAAAPAMPKAKSVKPDDAKHQP